MYTWTALALSLLTVSVSAAPPHLEARKGAAPVGGPASAKVTIYSSYTCAAPGTVSNDPSSEKKKHASENVSRPHPRTAVQEQQPHSRSQKLHARFQLQAFCSEEQSQQHYQPRQRLEP